MIEGFPEGDATGINVVASVHNLSKSFGGVQALGGLDLKVGRGEVLAIVGDNGAGKSTFIKCAAGILRPDNGEIVIAGQSFEALSPERARACGIEVVYQNLGLIDLLDIVQNLFANRELVAKGSVLRRIGWLDSVGMYAEAARTFEAFGLDLGRLDRPVRELSGGQRQMLAIIRAVHSAPRLIMMDEPTAALGVEQSLRVLGLVQTLAARGIAVILVSHNMDHVFRVADRIVVLRHGFKVADAPRTTLTVDDVVAHITGSRERTSLH